MPFRCIYDTKYLFCYHLSLLSFHLSILSEEWTWIAVKSQTKKITLLRWSIRIWNPILSCITQLCVMATCPMPGSGYYWIGSAVRLKPHLLKDEEYMYFWHVIYYAFAIILSKRIYIFAMLWSHFYAIFHQRKWRRYLCMSEKLSFPDLIILLLLCWVINEQMVLYGHVAQSIFRTYRSVR